MLFFLTGAEKSEMGDGRLRARSNQQLLGTLP